MSSIEEFAFIAAQLEWLEKRLREQPPAADSSRMEGALNALACARAVMVQLANIGSALEQPATAPAA